MIRKFNLSILTVLLSFSMVFGQHEGDEMSIPPQNPPVTMESLVGNRGLMYQLIVNKKFQSIPRLGFFSVTNGTGAWERELVPDIMSQAHLTYGLFKGLDITSGMQYTPVYGFRPVAGLIYTYASPELLMILNPKVDLASDMASEAMGLLEYKPRLNENFNFYSRIQGLYGFVPKSGNHNRSYVMLRAGLNFREFSFGIAGNFDWYGPMNQYQKNVGVFMNVLLF